MLRELALIALRATKKFFKKVGQECFKYPIEFSYIYVREKRKKTKGEEIMVLHLLFFTIVLAIVNDIIEMIGD